jgi:hypothetical protein
MESQIALGYKNTPLLGGIPFNQGHTVTDTELTNHAMRIGALGWSDHPGQVGRTTTIRERRQELVRPAL